MTNDTYLPDAADVGAASPWGPVPIPPPGHTWESLMDRALRRASKNLFLTDHAEVPVGAVVVSREGFILSEATNCSIGNCDPTGHAEIAALRAAAQTVNNYRLEGCVLVVTLEPCLMCAGAIVHARLDGVVYGATDRRAGAVQSCLDGFELPFFNHKVWHYGGVRSAECAELLRDFFVRRRSSSAGSSYMHELRQ